MLIKSNLFNIYHGTKSGDVYLYFAIYDISGELRHQKTRFFASLNSHTYLSNEYKIRFESGIVLNVFDVIIRSENIYIKSERIFRGKRPKYLKILYIFWDDPSCKLSIIIKKDFEGPFGKNKNKIIKFLFPRNKDFYCRMTLQQSDNKTLELGLGNFRARQKYPLRA
jgi:hypothetical protein